MSRAVKRELQKCKHAGGGAPAPGLRLAAGKWGGAGIRERLSPSLTKEKCWGWGWQSCLKKCKMLLLLTLEEVSTSVVLFSEFSYVPERFIMKTV